MTQIGGVNPLCIPCQGGLTNRGSRYLSLCVGHTQTGLETQALQDIAGSNLLGYQVTNALSRRILVLLESVTKKIVRQPLFVQICLRKQILKI